MIDIETLGTRPGCAVLSLGAVAFSDMVVGVFYRRIDPLSCAAAGLRAEIDTAIWWLRQSEAARAELSNPVLERLPLSDALRLFIDWLVLELPGTALDDISFWANGASFEFPILEAAFVAAGLPVPWKYHQQRDYRTISALFRDIPKPKNSGAHNALHDASVQAQHLCQILAALNKRPALRQGVKEIR